MSVLAGDLVTADPWPAPLVVVDVAGADAVLREKGDTKLVHPIIAPVADLTIVGHLDAGDVPGWEEIKPGEWVKTDDEH